MIRLLRLVVSCAMLSTALGLSIASLWGQQANPSNAKAAPAAAAKEEKPAPEKAPPEAGQPVVVQRQAMRLIPREHYQVPLQLQAARMIQLTSPIEGTVRELRHKTGDKVEGQAEIIRLDSVEQQLLVDRAKANYRASQIEVKRAQSAAGGDKDLIELAEARAQAAKAELDLATYRLEQTSIRAPFNAEVFRVLVTPGQVVRAGEILATVGDTAQMIAELPVDRKSAAPGKGLTFHIESDTIEGKVESILPPDARFEPLRELVDSVATGVVLVENSAGKLRVGQTVYSALVPRDPVCEIPNSAIANLPDGARKVQVVRGNVIRDIRVELRGGVGTARSFVSGAFDDGDEVIVSISQELPDGTLLRPHSGTSSVASESGATGTTTGSSTAVSPRTKLPSTKSNDPPAAKKSAF